MVHKTKTSFLLDSFAFNNQLVSNSIVEYYRNMIKIKEDIISKLNEGSLLEHKHDNLELKSSWKQENGKKISALANKNLENKCWLCVGINDEGQICSNEELWAIQTAEQISNHINNYLNPFQVVLSVTCHELNNNWFIIISIKNPGVVTYWNEKPYKAAGTTIAEMSAEEIIGLTVTLPGLTDYSAQIYKKGYNSELVKKYAKVVSIKRTNDIYKDLDQYEPEKILSILGIANKNVVRILFGSCKFRVVYFDKNKKPIKNDTYQGLYDILHDDFIDNIQSWSAKQLNLKKEPYSNRALKESIANAIAHAAYFESDGDIILEIFPDKLSISNLCLNESIFYANKWFSSAHNTINRALMESLRLSGYVDELGMGKNVIYSEALKQGKKQPNVVIEKGGRYNRWRLNLFGGSSSVVKIKLLKRLKEKYPDENKALIANALVLWRGQSKDSISKYLEGEYLTLANEVLDDAYGPIFYWRDKNEIHLRRWVSVLLGEGKDSKQLSPAEELDLYISVKKIRLEHHHGYVTPKDLRDWADLGEAKSSQGMSSKLLKKWQSEEKVEWMKRGVYRFIKDRSLKGSLEEILRVSF